MTQCTATSKRTKQRCGGQAVPPGKTCHWHGGRSPRGLAHPSTKTGARSLDMPTRLAANFQAALDDPDLIVQRREAALLEARLSDLLSRVDTGEAGAIWQALGKAAGEFNRASRIGESADALIAAREMAALAAKGKSDWGGWREVLFTIEALGRTKDRERKRLESAHNVLTADRVLLLVAALSDAVRRHVSDRKTLDLIGREISRLVGDGARDGQSEG